MNKRIKKLWVAALRSGDYEQGAGALRNDYNSFCCLGVLCNIHAQEHPEFAATQWNRRVYDGDSGILTTRVRKWAQFRENSQDKLIVLNDDKGWDFDRIANYIDKNL